MSEIRIYIIEEFEDPKKDKQIKNDEKLKLTCFTDEKNRVFSGCKISYERLADYENNFVEKIFSEGEEVFLKTTEQTHQRNTTHFTVLKSAVISEEDYQKILKEFTYEQKEYFSKIEEIRNNSHKLEKDAKKQIQNKLAALNTPESLENKILKIFNL